MGVVVHALTLPVAVVSDAFWRARLESDPNLTAHTIHLNGTAYQVVGVMPPGFSGEGRPPPITPDEMLATARLTDQILALRSAA